MRHRSRSPRVRSRHDINRRRRPRRHISRQTDKFSLISSFDRSRQSDGPDELAAALGASLSLLYRRLRQSISEGELTLPERSALSRIARGGPMTASALAKQEQISAQSIGATLATLEQRELVARTPDPDDGRRIILTLTDAGHAAVDAKRAARNARLSQGLSANFTAAERAQLAALTPLIERLAESL
ncbi:MAG TPA: MarR family transcriptional regulator [Solirubrobacteraceae bacterium]|nr:MarR family transcriptional regulator [Solirubrobacteraceae bacterium]